MTSSGPAQASNFKQYYLSLPTNDDGNKNLAEFSLALSSDETLDARIKNITEENTVILTAGQNGMLQMFHSIVNLGGTRFRREHKVIALMGMGSRAASVLLDIELALADCNITTPTLEEIKSCNSIAQFKALETPDQGPNPTFEGSGSFIPGPFLLDTILQVDSLDPMELIPSIFSSAERFDNEHADEEGYTAESAMNHAVDFVLFATGVMQGSIQETRFQVKPDDAEMTDWLEHRIRKCIMPSLQETSRGVSSQQGDSAVLNQLAASISMQTEEARESNRLRQAEIDRQKSKDHEKKNRLESKLHPSVLRLILNASSEDGDRAASSPTKNCLAFFNADSSALAEIELATQFKTMGLGSVAFSSGFTQNLYMGQLAYNFPGAPSNLSVFCMYEGDPMSNDIVSRNLSLHLLKSNGVNRSMKDIQDSLKQILRCPKDFNEMIDQANYMYGLCRSFFGDNSASAFQWKAFVNNLLRNRGNIKSVIAGDNTTPTKILYAADLRTQRWLKQCEEADDRADVDDDLLNFSHIVEDTLNQSLRVNLPPVFDVQRPDPEPREPVWNETDGGKQRGKKRGRGDLDEDDKTRGIVRNEQQVPSLKLKPGEDWNDIKSKLPHERPTWDGEGGKRMCLRYHTKGYCFPDCKNKASHVPRSQVPAKKVTEMESFLARARNE